MAGHRELELRGGLALGDADDEDLEDVLERAVGRFLRRSKDRELLGILRPAEPFDLLLDPGELDAVEPLLPPLGAGRR